MCIHIHMHVLLRRDYCFSSKVLKCLFSLDGIMLKNVGGDVQLS